MPVYNAELFLEEALRANLSQTYGDFDLVIADNASTDRTRDICLDIAARDPRVTYIRNEMNLGAARNYSRCFEPFRCEYFRWANADDLPEPTLVEKCVEVLDSDPGTVLAYGKTRLIDKDGAFLRDYEDDMELLQEKASGRFRACLSKIGLNNVIYGLMRRTPLAKTGLLGPFQGSDINLVGELSLYGKFREIPERLFSRRLHSHASSWDTDKERQRKFWNPSKRRLTMRTWRSFFEYQRAVLRSPLGVSEKSSTLLYLLRRASWQRKSLIEDVIDLVRLDLSQRRGR